MEITQIIRYNIVDEKIVYTVLDSKHGEYIKMKPSEIKNHSLLVEFWKKESSDRLKELQLSDRFSAKPRAIKRDLVEDTKNVRIVGLKKHQGKLYVATEDLTGAHLVDIEEARSNFPAQLASFFESRI